MPTPIHPQARIGHGHLKVADPDRAIAFHHGVLGFQITRRYGKEAAFPVGRTMRLTTEVTESTE